MSQQGRSPFLKHEMTLLFAVQVSVDISTPPSAFEAVEAAAVAHFKANPNDFSGEKMIIANIAGDPLKYMLCVWWEYAYPGQSCMCYLSTSCPGQIQICYYRYIICLLHHLLLVFHASNQVKVLLQCCSVAPCVCIWLAFGCSRVASKRQHQNMQAVECELILFQSY